MNLKSNRYGVALVGVRPESSREILLNPGRRHIMKKKDMCFYLSIPKDKNSSVVAAGDHTIVDLENQVTTERYPSFFVFSSAAALSEEIIRKSSKSSVVILP
jgi:hypothetical protein